MNKNYQSGNLIIKQSQEGGALILGDCNSALDKKIQKLYKIQTIISIGQQAMPPKQKLPQNCTHKFYDIHDNKSQKVPPQLFDQISDHIQEGRKKGGVLVHCYAGVSRSSTFVIAYIMRKYFFDYDKSKQLVKKHRSCIHPGDGFIHQLKYYWKVLQKRQEQRLKQLQRLNMKKQPQKEQIQLSPSKRRGLRGAVKIADVPPQKVKQIQSKFQSQSQSQSQSQQKQKQKQESNASSIQPKFKQQQAKNNQQKKLNSEYNNNIQLQLITAQKQIKPEDTQQKIKTVSISHLQKPNQNNNIKVKVQPKKQQIKKVIITDKKIITKKVQQKQKQKQRSSRVQLGQKTTKVKANTSNASNNSNAPKEIINKQPIIDSNKLQNDKYQKTKNIYTTKTKVL